MATVMAMAKGKARETSRRSGGSGRVGKVRIWRARPRGDFDLLFESYAKPSAGAGEAGWQFASGTGEAAGAQRNAAARPAEETRTVPCGAGTATASDSDGLSPRCDWRTHRGVQQKYECHCRCFQGRGAIAFLF